MAKLVERNVLRNAPPPKGAQLQKEATTGEGGGKGNFIGNLPAIVPTKLRRSGIRRYARLFQGILEGGRGADRGYEKEGRSPNHFATAWGLRAEEERRRKSEPVAIFWHPKG